MDVLNRAYAHLYDLFRAMTPGTRLATGLLLVVAAISVGYLFAYPAVAPDVDLFSGRSLTADEMPKIVAAFHNAKLKSYEIRNGAAIRVPRNEVGAYMAALVAADALPPDGRMALHKAVDNASFFDAIAGRQRREQQDKLALEDFIGQSIREKPGIEKAFVTINEDVKPGLTREKQIVAMVSVTPVGSLPLSESQVADVRTTVAGAIPGLDPERVTVSDSNGRTWFGKFADNAAAGEDRYLVSKRLYEQDLRSKILDALNYIPGVKVAVNVELTGMHKPSAKTPLANVQAANVHTVNYGNAAANLPLTMGGSDAPAAAGPSASNLATTLIDSVLGSRPGPRAADKQAASTAAVASENEATGQGGPQPCLARASIGVPLSYIKRIWENNAPQAALKTAPDRALLDRIGQEKAAEIRRQIAYLLPAAAGVADPAELVAVTTFVDLPIQETAATTTAQKTWAFLQQYGGMLALAGLALVSLFVLRSVARAGAAALPSLYAASTTADVPADEEFAEPLPLSEMRRGGADRSLRRDELSEIVRQNPNAAANILRTWVSNSG